MIEVELPDGSIAEFPEGTDRGVIQSALQKRFAPDQKESSLLGKAGHLAGVANKAVVTGLADLPGTIGDVATYLPRKVTEKLIGQDIQPFSDVMHSGIDQLSRATGIGADPETAGERILAAGARGGANAVGGVGLGQQLARSAGPLVANTGEFIAQNPAIQSVSGASSGASGQAAKESGMGPAGQTIASLGGGLAAGLLASPFATGSAGGGLPPGTRTGPSTPPTPQSEYQNAVNALQQENIPLTTGQRTGTNWIKSTERSLAEVPLGGRPIQNAFQDQARAYQAALLRQAGNEAGDNMITRETLDNTRASLGQKYAAALGGKTLDLADPGFSTAINSVESQNQRLLPTMRKSEVSQIVDDFKAQIAANPNMSGEDYQLLRSQLGKKANATKNEYISGLYDDLKKSLDNQFEKAAGSDKFEVDKQYARMRQLQNIYERSGGPAASEGFISPIQAAREAAGAPGGTDWQDFTRAASIVLPDRLGQSGTAPRQMVLNALTGGGALMHPLATAATLGSTNLLSRGLAAGIMPPNQEQLAQALLRAGYPASIAALQQQQ